MREKKLGFKDCVYVQRPLMPEFDVFKDYIQDILSTKRLTNNGLQQEYLSNILRDRLEVNYLSLFTNESIALMVAIKALRLSGEVIVSPFAPPMICGVLDWLNLDFKFCDIDNETMNINSDKIQQLITQKTSAIIVPHIFGHPCNIYKINEIAKTSGVKVIYDATHAFGVRYNGEGICSLGDITLVGFHALEIFNTAEGAALTCGNDDLKYRIDLLKNYGMDLTLSHEQTLSISGINGRMNELQAALGNINFEQIDKEIEKRGKLIEIYEEMLKNIDGITFTHFEEFVLRNHSYFTIKIDEQEFGRSRDWVHKELKSYNIFARKNYPLCSNYACYSRLPSADPVYLPIANQVADQSLTLPLYGELLEDDVKEICQIIKSFAI